MPLRDTHSQPMRVSSAGGSAASSKLSPEQLAGESLLSLLLGQRPCSVNRLLQGKGGRKEAGTCRDEGWVWRVGGRRVGTGEGTVLPCPCQHTAVQQSLHLRAPHPCRRPSPALPAHNAGCEQEPAVQKEGPHWRASIR